MKPCRESEILAKWAYSLLDAEEFRAYLFQDASFETVLGKTTYQDLLVYDYYDKFDISQSRRRVMEYLNNTENDLLARYKASFILDRMIENPVELLPGVRRLSLMVSEGHDFIPVIFVGFSCELDSVPTEEEANLWEKSAFDRAREPLNLYREQILREACSLRNVLREYGIQT